MGCALPGVIPAECSHRPRATRCHQTSAPRHFLLTSQVRSTVHGLTPAFDAARRSSATTGQQVGEPLRAGELVGLPEECRGRGGSTERDRPASRPALPVFDGGFQVLELVRSCVRVVPSGRARPGFGATARSGGLRRPLYRRRRVRVTRSPRCRAGALSLWRVRRWRCGRRSVRGACVVSPSCPERSASGRHLRRRATRLRKRLLGTRRALLVQPPLGRLV